MYKGGGWVKKGPKSMYVIYGRPHIRSGGTQVVLNSSLVTSFSMAQELKPFDLLDKEHIRELHYGHK